MSTINCIDCGRANAADARHCLWCGLPLIRPGSPIDFEPIRAEVSYLDGFERLDGPATVELAVSPAGVEVREMMPGTRSIVLAFDSITGASVTGPLRTIGSQPRKGSSGWLKLRNNDDQPAAGRVALTLKFREEGEDRTVVFERDDAGGVDPLRRIARTITLLLKLKSVDSA